MGMLFFLGCVFLIPTSSTMQHKMPKIPLLSNIRAPLFAELNLDELVIYLQEYIEAKVDIRVNQTFRQNVEENSPAMSDDDIYKSTGREDLLNETNTIRKDFVLLQNDYQSLKSQFSVLQQQSVKLSRKVQEVGRQLEKKTKSLEINQNVTTSDFHQQSIALLRKVNEIEHKLEKKTRYLNATVFQVLQKNVFDDKKLIDKTVRLEAIQRETSAKLQQQTVKLQQELDKMANRAQI